MRAHRTKLPALIGLMALTLSTLYLGSAEAATASCGQTITANFTLDNDVGPCDGPGLVVTGSNFTLNLNKHRVFGNFDQGASGEFAGIALRGTTGVTVTGAGGSSTATGPRGTVEGFEAGVLVDEGSRNTVQLLTAQENRGLDDPDNSFLGDGIAVFNSPSNTIRSNVVKHNGIWDGISALGAKSNYNIIANNKVLDTISPGFNNANPGTGILVNPVLEFPSPTPGASIFGNQILGNVLDNNFSGGISNISNVKGVIRGNTVTNSGRDENFGFPGNGIGLTRGELATRASNVRVEGNILTGNRRGLQIQTTDDNQILHNQITGSFGDASVLLNGGNRNLLTDNDISHNFSFGIFSVQTTGTKLTSNTFNDNSESGIFFRQPTSNLQLLFNQVHGNASAGIFIQGATNSVFRYNNAANNGGPDLFDSRPNCSTNVWFGNIWGSGGFNKTCVTTGGSGPISAAASAQSASAADTGPLTADEPAPATGRHARPKV